MHDPYSVTHIYEALAGLVLPLKPSELLVVLREAGMSSATSMTLNQENGRDWILIKRKLFNMKTNLITITRYHAFTINGLIVAGVLTIIGGYIPYTTPPIVIVHGMTYPSALLSLG